MSESVPLPSSPSPGTNDEAWGSLRSRLGTPIRELLIGLGALLPWTLAEVAVGGGPWRAALVGIALAIGFGVPLGLLADRMPRLVLRLAVLLVPLLAHVSVLNWAIHRGIELWVPAASPVGLLAAALLLVVLGTAAWTAVRATSLEVRWWHWAASAFIVFCLTGPIFAAHPRLWLGMVLELGGVGVVLVLATNRAGRFGVFAAALVAGVAGLLVPVSYSKLESLLGWWTLGLTVLGLREVLDAGAARGRAPRRAEMLGVGAALIVAAVCLWGASILLSAGSTAWKRHANRGGLASWLVHQGRAATDWDRDGHGIWLGQCDCAPLDASVFPGAAEIPGNGRDDNCQGGDATSNVAEWLRLQLEPVPPPPSWKGDIVLVLVDAMRPDEAARPELVNIRHLLFDGLYFEHAYATSTFTPESLVGLLAGRLPASVPFDWIAPYHGCPERPVVGLPFALQQRGYYTIMVGTPGDTTTCFDPDKLGNGFDRAVRLPYFSPASLVVDRAVAAWRVASSTEQPRLLYVHLLQAHNAAGTLEGFRRGLVDVDRHLGRLMTAVGDDALWITLADHGQEFGERGAFGHANTLFEELARVPLGLRGPPVAAGRVRNSTSLLWLPETILSMVDGISVPRRGILCTRPVPFPCPDEPAPLQLIRPGVHWRALVLGRRKVIRNVNAGWVSAFDLDSDPEERTPLSPLPRDLLQALLQWEEYGFSSSRPLTPGIAHLEPPRE